MPILAEVGDDFPSGFGFYLGANSILNTYPEDVRSANSLGTGFSDTVSPSGFTGGSWYGRANDDW